MSEHRDPDPILDSDPSGNAAAGLSGDLGVSSERRGPMRGNDHESTHGAEDTSAGEPPEDGGPPEQSADPRVGGPETNTPEHTADYRRHESDPTKAPDHHAP